MTGDRSIKDQNNKGGDDSSKVSSDILMSMLAARMGDKTPEAAKPATPKAETPKAETPKVEHKPDVHSPSSSALSLRASSFTLASSDHLTAKPKVEKEAPSKPATAGNVSSAAVGGFGRSLYENVNGFFTLGGSKATSESDLLYQAATGTSKPGAGNSSVRGFFETGKTIATNIDKVPGALAGQAGDLYKTVKSGDAVKIADAGGHLAGTIATIFLPVGATSKVGTTARETAILANGVKEVKAASTLVSDYARLNGITEAAAASKVTRMPIPSVSEMRAATARVTENVADDAVRLATPAAKPHVPIAEKPPVVAAAEKPPVVAAAEKPPVVAAAEKPPVVAAAEKPPVAAAAEKPPVVAADNAGNTNAAVNKVVQPEARPIRNEGTVTAEGAIAQPEAGRIAQTHVTQPDGRVIQPESSFAQTEGRVAQTEGRVSQTEGRLVQDARPTQDLRPAQAQEARVLEPGAFEPKPAQDLRPISEARPAQDLRPVSEPRPVSEARPISEAVPEVAPVKAPVQNAGITRNEIIANTARNEQVIEGAVQSAQKVEATTKLTESTAELSNRVQGATRQVEVGSVVERELKEISRDLETVARGASPDKVMQSVQHRITAIENHGAKEIAQDLRRGVDDVQKSSTQARGHGVDRVESSTPVPVAQAALTEDVAQVGAKSRQLSTTVEREMSTLVGADKQIAQDLAKDVRAIERAVESKNISGVQTLVDDLAKKPEFAKLFQENPRLAEGLNDLRTSTAAMTRSENVLEGAVQTAQRTEASVQLSQGSSKLAGQAEAAIVRAESPVVQRELQEVAKDMRTIAQGADPQAVATSVRKRLEVIEAQGPSAAPIARDLRSGLDDVEKLTGNARAVGVGRVEPVVVPQQLTAKLGEDVARVGRNTQPLSSAIEVEAMALKGADREIAEKIANDLRGIERASQPQAIKTPVESSREIQRLVDDLAKPEYSRFFAERPHLAEPLRDLRTSANNMGRNQSLVENSMRSVERLETGVKLGQETTTFSTRVETLAQSQPAAIQRELKEIANDVRTISQSANPDKVIAGVRNRLEVIQEQGGAAIARDLRAGVDDIEKLSLSANRATRVETAAVTIEREGAVVADRASVLSRELKPVAEVAPSKGAALPVETQVSKHLDNIAEQARVVATSPDQVRAITSMRNSINQIEELGGARILRPEQAKAYQELTQSISRMDKAAVEIRGVQSVENVGRNIARPLDAMPNVAQDLTKAVRTAGKEEALAANLRRVEEASLELKGARTLDEQVAASKKLGQELDNPQLKALTQENAAVRNAHTRLADEVSRVDELAHLARRERQVARVEGQVDDLTEKVARVERPVPNTNVAPNQPVANINQPALRNATQEYQVAINDIRRGATDANAVSRADRALVKLESEATTSGVAVQTIQDIRQGHKALVTSTRELEESTRIVVSKGVERIEKGFSDVEKATSTVAQRQIIRETSDRIQDLRYVDTNPVGASQLEQAQTRLMRAHNDIEVATYRSNLVKLAAAGDQTALDKLLISGLNKDGNRLAALSADAPGYLSTRAFLMGQGRDGAFVRNLSAADPFFTNNRGLLINPMTVGAAKVGLLGTIGYLEANDLANRIDRQLLIEEYEKSLRERGILGDAAAATSAAASAAAAAAAANENLRVLPKQGMLGGELKSSQLPPPSEIIRSTPIISPQTLMRSASSFSNQNRVVANQNRLAAGQNYGIQQLSAAAPLAKPERVAFGIFEDDPDKYMKMSLMTTFGTPFIPLRQGSTVRPDEVVVAPVVRAGSVPVKFTYHGDGRIESRLDKPATSQYVLPSAMSLANPLSLTRDNQARKDGAMRSSIFASQSNITGSVTSGKPVAKSDLSALSSYVNAETEGSGGHDARKLNDIEESETGVDRSGSGAVVVNSAAANNAMDDDDDDENNGPQPTVNSRVPKVPQPVMADASGAAAPVMDNRAKIGVPPRKRTQAS